MDAAAFETYVALAEIDNSWVESQLEWLRGNVRRNELSQHWYQLFRSSEDMDVSWGALQAALKCGDQRFKVWRKTIEERDRGDTDRKDSFLAVNWDQVVKKLDREKDRKDTLFGIKIPHGEVVPFVN